jgi:phage tail-like protein
VNFPTRHQLLRDRRQWLGNRSGLATDRDGDLLLARVPAPSDGRPIDLATNYPYVREVSGLALGPCDAVFVADTAHDCVLYVDGLCATQAWLPPRDGGPADAPGHLRAPRGLALTADALLVADSDNARVQGFALPRLEAHIAWNQWAEPTSLDVDSKQRVLIVDAATRGVNRVSAFGIPDGAFDSNLAAQGKLQAPLFVCCGENDRVLVSDAQANAVFVFEANGDFALALQGPPAWQPGALAVFGARVYVADAATGAIFVFDIDVGAGQLVGQVNGWRGPVTALATGADGALYIKPGLDALYHRFAPDAAYVAQGTLIAGPFDAGEERTWERVWVDAQVPPTTSLTVWVVPQNAPAAPTANDWLPLPAFDVLLSRSPLSNSRFIWVRLQLTTGAAQQSPRVQQARTATADEDLRDYLPLTYRRHDKDADGFLSRWLKLIRGEFGRIGEFLDDMPRTGDPQFAAASSLSWLAQWLGLELPQIADDDQRRALVARAVQLYARRGTKDSIAEFVELHTGIRPVIVEAFADRRVWVLGATSRLDFDTRLAPLDPLGMIVPDNGAGNGCCADTGAETDSTCSPCATGANTVAPAAITVSTPIGRAVVGEGGPLASYQIGLPLFADTAYRFCVVVDGYRAHDAATRAEIARIVEREKPAHTDYRLEFIAPEMRVGLQAQIGVDAIVGGDPPPLRLNPARLGTDTQLPPSDVARFGGTTLDGMLTLT